MKLIDHVNAYIATEELGKRELPYDIALALVKTARRVKEEALFFLEKERELAMEYALLDESGKLKLTPGGGFAFKPGANAAEYESRRRELAQTDVRDTSPPLRVKAPAHICPKHIEALEGFIEFENP